MKYQIFLLGGVKLYDDEPSSRFRYGIEFKLVQGGGMLYFHDVRKWLITSYGWADQLGNAVSNVDNEYWSWNVNHDSYKIYLCSDRELMMFKLKFPVGDSVLS